MATLITPGRQGLPSLSLAHIGAGEALCPRFEDAGDRADRRIYIKVLEKLSIMENHCKISQSQKDNYCMILLISGT